MLVAISAYQSNKNTLHSKMLFKHSQHFTQCLRRFDFTAQPPKQCSLDVDEDGVVDIEVHKHDALH